MTGDWNDPFVKRSDKELEWSESATTGDWNNVKGKYTVIAMTQTKTVLNAKRHKKVDMIGTDKIELWTENVRKNIAKTRERRYVKWLTPYVFP